MQLLIIRHAHALDANDDAARPLSEKGRDQVRRVARFLRANGAVEPMEIWHSPLVRAQQSAVLFAKHAQLSAPLCEVDGLLPDDEPKIMTRRLERMKRPVAIVGHEPHLSALASLLVGRKAFPPCFKLKKGTVLALKREGGRWVVRWQIGPDLLA